MTSLRRSFLNMYRGLQGDKESLDSREGEDTK